MRSSGAKNSFNGAMIVGSWKTSEAMLDIINSVVLQWSHDRRIMEDQVYPLINELDII